MAADTSAAAADAPQIETGPNTACPAPLKDVAASAAEIVAAWLTVEIEAVGLDAAETLVVVRSWMAADSGDTGSELSGSYPW